MKTGKRILRGLLATLTLLATASHADNACIENGPYTNAVGCVRPGTWVSGGLTPTNITVGVGQAIVAPTASGYALTNGLGQYYVYYDCPNSGPDHYFTNQIGYALGNPHFVPAMPSLIWTPGIYSYTGMVAAAGSPCSPLTNQLGTVTILVISNNPDVLLDVDFGVQITSAKAGYAALGDGLGDFWNEYSQTNRLSGALANLKTAEGATSPVGLLVTNLPLAGVNGSSDPMYNDYLKTNAGTATLTFSNLPAGTWNVYLYSQDGNFTLTTGATSWGTQTCFDSAPGSSPVAWQQGRQYAVFPNVTVSNGQPLTVSINPGINGAALISGLQIASANHMPPPISAGASSLVAWGYNLFGQTNVPAGLNNIVAIAGGGFHNLALQANGRVVAWGLNTLGQTNVPAGLTNAVAIAGGNYDSLALTGNGRVVGWGSNNFGQTNAPAGLTNAVAIAAGNEHNLALRSNGTVAAWGYNFYGQASVPSGLSNVVAIAAGADHSLALTANGTVVAWGYNAYGQTNVPAGLTNVVAIAAGADHSLALKANGTVVAWGYNASGQASVPAGLTNVVAIAGGALHSLALKANGTVVAWGYNGSGQTSIPAGLGNVVAIAGGYYHSLALRNATIPASEIPFLYPAGAPGYLNVTLDSDYDGVSDLQEIASRTDPFDPSSVPPIRLGYWPFDNTNTWVGGAGQLPLTATNLAGVPSWDTNAVRLDTNQPAILGYRDVETNGNANINLRSGSVRFWFNPDWTSVAAGGSGPGAYGRLIEMGSNSPVFNANSWSLSRTNGWWSLFFTPDGNNLVFGASTNGAGGVNLAAGISWTTNQWHQVVLTYSPTNSSLYVDGQLAGTGAASLWYPNLTERSRGFRIGSDQNGVNQARGAFDELETFNYPLAASDIATNYQYRLNWSVSGSGLPNLWQWNNFGYEGVSPSGNPAGDGLSNLQKYQNNLNPYQFYPARLGYWRFNNPPSWLDESNLAPSTAYGLYPVPSWSGDAVRLTTAQNSVLNYPGIRANGSAVAVCPAGTGTIRFWFKPEWSTAGGGPGDVVQFFEIGQQSTNAAYGWFSLWADTAGRKLTFSTEANGIHTDNAIYPISLTTNAWYQIVLTYTSSNSLLYVNGLGLATNGLGATNLPSQVLLQQGFYLGCSWDGVDQANGVIDELETFNYALSASAVESNYLAVMSVDTYGTGLPDVIKNAYGLNPTAVDSDCDGLPDAWKIANGLNPTDPSVATPAMLAAYASGSNATAQAYGMLTAQTNIFNIEFTSSAGPASALNMSGALVSGTGRGADVWNFCGMNSPYFTSGMPVENASGNGAGAKLYAYIGPCINSYLADPTPFLYSIFLPTNWESLTPPVTISEYATFDWRAYANSCTNIAYLNGKNVDENPLNYLSGWGLIPDDSPTGLIGNSEYGLDGTLLYTFIDYGLDYSEFLRDWQEQALQSYYPLWDFIDTNPFNTAQSDGTYCFYEGFLDPYIFSMALDYWTLQYLTSSFDVVVYPFNFYIDDNGNTNGPYYNMNSKEQAAIQSAFSDSDGYAHNLYKYLMASGFSLTNTGNCPLGNVCCYIPPFADITHNGSLLAGTDGATWRFSGAGETQSGGWFKKFYTEAKRTLLITGLSPGMYAVYLYYDSPENVAPASCNGVAGSQQVTAQGTKYWFCKVPTTSIVPPTNVVQCLDVLNLPEGTEGLSDMLAGVLPFPSPVALNLWQSKTYPVWWTNVQNGVIRVTVDSPNVFDATSDMKLLGMQVVRVGDISSSSTWLDALPGLNAAYLNWTPSEAAINYNIYRSVGNTNSWVLLASTTQLTYQDTGLTNGVTYYYQVAGVDPVGILASGTLEPPSAVASTVPFACPNPLPPRIDYVNPLQIPPVSGTYSVSYPLLLTNSDALDPQGYPLVFKVGSVVSGSLTIDGAPFSAVNNTVGITNSVVWSPPAVPEAAATPAFQVYVSDGINRSANTVNVVIKQAAKTYVMSWGDNNFFSEYHVGYLGNGTIDLDGMIYDTTDYPNSGNRRVFMDQDQAKVYPNSMLQCFKCNSISNYSEGLGDPPSRVLNLDSVSSIACWGDGFLGWGHCAITPDSRLWFWGDAGSYMIGMPLVIGFKSQATYSYNTPYDFGPTHWDSGMSEYPNAYWTTFNLTLPSPVPVLDSQSGQPLTGVILAKDQYLVKADGSLWSVGRANHGPDATIGRQPINVNDAFPGGYPTMGMMLGQVEIDGNDNNGVVSGREIVEVNTCGFNFATWGDATLARCKDGSLWAWGAMSDAGFSFQLSGDTQPDVLPVRLSNVEAASSSPIVQVSEGWNHIVIWRQDGSLSELGYIPSLAPATYSVGFAPGDFGLIADSSEADFSVFYRNLPVPVNDVPSDIKQVAAAPTFAAILTESGDVWIWGQWMGQYLPTPQKIPSMSGIVKIVTGGQYMIGLDKRGRLWGIGINNDGAFGYNDLVMSFVQLAKGPQLGWYPIDLNGAVYHHQAVQIPGIENVVDVFSGDHLWNSQVYAIGSEVQGKPTGLTATPMNQSVQLSWSNYPSASSYVVYRSLNEDAGYVAIGTAAVNSYLDQAPPLQNGQVYYYEVSAVVNGVETAPSWEVAATPYPAPNALGQLTAWWACGGIELQWLPPTNLTASPLDDYVVLADNVQLAELQPGAINYYDSREGIASNSVYQVIARNSSGQAVGTIQLSPATPTIGCPPAPVIATNSSSGWLTVRQNTGGGSDQATLVWTGADPASGTNSSWLFQPGEFDTYLGNPASGVPSVESVDDFISRLADAYPGNSPLEFWLWNQISGTKQTILTNAPQTVSALDTANMLASGGSPLQAWLWQQFSPVDTNTMLDPASTDQTIQNILIQDLQAVMASGLPTNSDNALYVAEVYQQVVNSSGTANAAEINLRLSVLTGVLNQVLTNGAPLTNDFFVGVLPNGYFPNGAQLRAATINLATNLPPPQGAALVQLKRMFLDDYFRGFDFVRAGNWGANLTGFRIHYRTLQYVNGQKLEQNLQQDVTLDSLQNGWNLLELSYFDDEGVHCGYYQYTWPIPQGALCWASVSALVNGQESELSDEVGPQAAPGGNDWTAGLRAVSGYHQVYLDWSDDLSANDYTVYWSTNPNDTNDLYPGDGNNSWLPANSGANLQENWFWQTNLAAGTTYYYFVQADDYFNGTLTSGSVFATVTNEPAPASYRFAAAAYPYDGMVDVEWAVPTNQNSVVTTSLNQTNWQFYVERKPAATGDSNYMAITVPGFGLAFLDSDVVDGQSYTYRVTAFDTAFNRLQAVAFAGGGSNTNIQITPGPTNGLTLLPPMPGNGYVKLTWSPIRATQFSIKRALNAAGPFDVVGSQNVNNAYQSAQNTYLDTGLQNGVTYYYQIAAITPTGFEIDSPVLGAIPLATLTPLAPTGFQGTIVPVGGAQLTNTVALAWNAESGVSQYQVFLEDQNSTTLLFTGRGTGYAYTIPDDQQADPTAVFTFALRSVNAQGLVSDLTTTTVTNQPNTVLPTQPNTVVLQIAGVITSQLTVAGPTNLSLSAQVNAPGVGEVSFYDGGNLIGTVTDVPYQMIWYQVPGGTHVITAVAGITSQAAVPSLGGGASTLSSGLTTLIVNAEPQLSAYQTSATDLQLPAPALPISLWRSYSSRSTNTSGVLGAGWTAGWTAGSIRLSEPLADGWNAFDQSATWSKNELYFITENVAHIVTMTLPDGQSTSFGVNLDYSPLTYPDSYSDITIGMDFQDYSANPGTLSSIAPNIAVDCPDWDDNLIWDAGVNLTVSPPSQFTYVGPDGTTNVFGQPLVDGVTWLLTQTTDRNGNSLNYVYDANNNVTAISNSCGRGVTFNYVVPPATPAGVTNVQVYDSVAPFGHGNLPVVVYVVSNSLLSEVCQLVNRTTASYLTNTYAYGGNLNNDPADYLRLTDVYDARGIRLLHNTYTNDPSTGQDTGDLAIQISPGKTNNFTIDANNNLIVTATTTTATNTVQVNSDASGSISGAMQPVSGTSPSTTNASQCSYDSQGNLISQTDANGNTTTYTYDAQNRLTGQSDGNSDSTSTTLNAYGQPTLSVDANGNQTAYEYDNNGNTLSVSDPTGTSTGYAYSAPVTVGNSYLGALQTRQTQVAPFVPYTIVTLNSYNTAGPAILGDLLQTTEEWQDSSGKPVGKPVVTQYTYDANGNRLTETKTRTTSSGPETILTQYTYDAQNRVLTTTVSASNSHGTQTLAPQTTTVTYNVLGKQATSTDAAGRVTSSIYDFNGNLIETDFPDGTVSRTCYDGFGHQQYVQDRAVPDANNNTIAPATLSLYDASGRVIETERCDAVKLTRTAATIGGDYVALPNSVPQVKMVVASPGTVLTTAFTFYDSVGNVQYSVDARGAVTQYQYDAANRRTNMVVYTAFPFVATGANTPNPTGPSQSTSYTYDANGNQLTVTDAAGHTTTSVYDEANRVIEMDYPAANGATVSQYTYYDGLGRKLQQNDEAGVATAYTYDFQGLLTSVTLAFGTTQSVTTVYGYDELGNEIAQTDAAGHSTTFQYDALGRKIARVLPGGQTETFGYDLAGDQIYQTNFNGVIITNQYDWASGRLTNCSTLGYQATYTYTPTGLRTNLVDPSGSTSYLYDDQNRLTNKLVSWHGGPAVTLKYGYDALGSLTNLWSTTANGVTNVYRYDLLGRLTNVLAGATSAATYGYDVVGNLQSLRYANAVTNLYQYDSRNRLTRLVWQSGNTSLASFAYTVGPTGNRTALAETVNGTSRTYNWAYDYLYRMTGETFSGSGYPTPQSVLYGFDPVGNRTNRTSAVSGIGSQTPTYTANDWLASDTSDANGNTTVSGTTNYQYDVMNHLVNVNNGQILLTYDGDGNRVSKTVNGLTTYYLVDDRNPSGYAQVLEEYTSLNQQPVALSRVYNYGLALISQRQAASGTVSYFGTDGHGSTRFLTDANANLTDTYAFDAYGLLIASTGSTPNNYLYCDQQWDSDLGFYYLRARYYKPDTGRFWTMDTYGGDNDDPLSLHKYVYCKGSPLDVTDPSGHDGEVASELGTISGIGYLAANLAFRAAPLLARATVVVFEATTGQSVIIGSGTVVAGGAALAKVEGGLGAWTIAAQNLQGILFGPYGYLKAVLKGSGGQANHLNQAGAYTQIAKEVGACVDLGGNALVQGTEHNQFHFVMEQFWNLYRRGGAKFNQPVSNKAYLQTLNNALTVVKDATGAPVLNQNQVNALVTLAEKEQVGYGYFDGPGGLSPKVPDSMNLK